MNTLPGSNDKYELQELLSRDGMAEVWKAFDTGTRRYVAIKFLHAQAQMAPEFVTRFQQDTLAIAALNHPNIVQYYDFSLTQSPGARNITASLVMNFVDGGTLADYIQNTARKGKFPAPGAVVPLFISIASALAYAHEHGIIHGQLKPTNILLDRRNTARNIMGEPIVTDFGIYKLRGMMASGTSGVGNWQNSSPVYMSPEQISGSPASERSDIYAFGIILYELCAGTTPFQGSNPATIIMQHLNTIPTSPALINPGLPLALTEIIMRCIAKDPAARFPGAQALIEALNRLDGDETIMASPSQSLPGSASQPDYSIKSMDLPTIFTRSPLSAGAYTPSQPGISGISYSPVPPTISSPGMAERGNPAATPYLAGPPSQVGSSQPYPTLQPGGQTVSLSSSAPRGPLTPMPPAGVYGQSAQNPAAAVTPQQPHPAPSAPSSKSGRPVLRIALVGLLILLVIGSSLGAYLLFFAKGPSTTHTPLPNRSAVVGHTYFVSSGLLIPNGTNGITDQLEIHLENIPAPAPGKAYYAWLLNDITLQPNPVYIGQLTVSNQGTVDFFYPGNTVKVNLLATNSRFLITEDDASVQPVSPDSGTNMYYAAFPQIPHKSGKFSFSLYDHLRHLLAAEPGLNGEGLFGGLDTWVFHNSQKILEWAGSARDATFAGSETFIRNQLSRIMCYLDGIPYIKHDLPQQTCTDSTVGVGARVGLLTFPGSFGFLQHITAHLDDIINLQEATAGQRALAAKIDVAINVVNQRFQTMRDDVLQLLRMPTAQWSQPAGISLRDTIATLANDAFVGNVDPQGNITDGVALINNDIQGLATFNVTPCPCTVS